jgi:hypothetical protein
VRPSDLDQRRSQPRLHRPQGNAVGLGDLARRHPAEVGPLEQSTLGLRQRRQRPEGLVALHQDLFLVDPGRVGHFIDEDEGRARRAVLAAQSIDGEVVGDRHEPGGEPAACGIEARGLPPGRDEHVLRELLRGLARTQQAKPHRVDGAGEPCVQGADGIVVTGKERFHQALLLPRKQRTVLRSGHVLGPSDIRETAGARLAPALRP